MGSVFWSTMGIINDSELVALSMIGIGMQFIIT
jgi:hypothetical protein